MGKNHLESLESFTNFLNTLNCVHCKFLGDKDKPVNERRCTHKFAYKKCYGCDNGLEGNKSWIRIDDINRELKGEVQFFSPRKDINEYFICDYFKEINNEKI